jgi:hypothetical protein
VPSGASCRRHNARTRDRVRQPHAPLLNGVIGAGLATPLPGLEGKGHSVQRFARRIEQQVRDIKRARFVFEAGLLAFEGELPIPRLCGGRAGWRLSDGEWAGQGASPHGPQAAGPSPRPKKRNAGPPPRVSQPTSAAAFNRSGRFWSRASGPHPRTVRRHSRLLPGFDYFDYYG